MVWVASSPDAAARSVGAESSVDGGECRAARAVCVPHRDGHPTGPPRGASPRQVRFYEAKSLITSTREPNNYRDYSEAALGRVQQIRELLNAGLSTQDIARNRHAIADYLAELQKRAE